MPPDKSKRADEIELPSGFLKRDMERASERVKELREGVTYILETRALKCAHAHPSPDAFCAVCRSRKLLEKTNG